MKRTIILPLNKKWFEMIKSGKKNEEYRNISRYYASRFCKNYNGCEDCEQCSFFRPKQYDGIIFTLGYPSNNDASRIISYSVSKIEIRCGKKDLGAEENKKYFVITFF